jgi:hypothetical protein
VSTCGSCNQPEDSVIGGNFIYQLTNYLLKKDFVPWCWSQRINEWNNLIAILMDYLTVISVSTLYSVGEMDARSVMN